jgi:hypothetical protein
MTQWVKSTHSGAPVDPSKPEGVAWTIVHVTPPVGVDCDIVPVVDADGKAFLQMMPRTVGPHGFYGCAICEQMHPVGTEGCPLAQHDTQQWWTGPLETEDGTIRLLVTERLTAYCGRFL